ncbi:MAG: hypothetical protein Q3997_03795 [Propionibacteriaceae bacterium]|nr:hypothetical protein [Propionibacteriaceae bacterium]
MQTQLVFVPVTAAERRQLRMGETLGPRAAFTVTPELCAALDYGPEELEDAEYAAMVIASVAGLARLGVRLVVVAEVAGDAIAAVTDASNGECELAALRSAEVTAFFAEEEGVDVTPAAVAAYGLGIDEAWELEEVQRLLSSTDLLWHGADEL